jgi:hypothetical protein
MRWILSIALLAAVRLPAMAQAAAPLTCPATVGAPGQSAPHSFFHVNVFNGKPGKQEADLAPDFEERTGSTSKIVQGWFLKDYRAEPIFFRCQYRGTKDVVNVPVPAKYGVCTFSFVMKKNEIVGTPEFACK